MSVSAGLCLHVVARMKLKAAQRSLGKAAVTEHMLRHLLLRTKALSSRRNSPRGESGFSLSLSPLSFLPSHEFLYMDQRLTLGGFCSSFP